MSNRLSQESSPYLRQHENNPVDWYPWGAEALAKAKLENKPILLSVGYSACHWCHVMAHESFENPEIAHLMNERFVNIKVDREERPDLDHIYQKVAQLMTQSGGWPLTVFLTPELKPFYGGTYFPPEDRYGRPGFPKVLTAIADVFERDPAKVADNANKMTEAMGSVDLVAGAARRLPDIEGLKEIAEHLLGIVDWDHGGVGGAPKFPNAMTITYLWRIGAATGDLNAQRAATLALTRMAEGGIYDQLGGGFHRYSVDQSWSVPHFEKMLYDNALLLKLYAEVVLDPRVELSPENHALYLRVLNETVDYVLREMRSAEGGFYSAQDADSEGEEGKFFVWDLSDLQKSLTPDEARVFAVRFGVNEVGNFEHGKTVLHINQQVSKEEEVLLTSACAKLMAVRGGRVAPGRDDKILVSWNGLMISGLSWAAQALRLNSSEKAANRADQAAAGAFEFIKQKMSTGTDRLLSVYKDGHSKFNAYLDDYAFLAMAALDLARFSDSSQHVADYLDQSCRWVDTVLKHFKSSGGHGYNFTSDDHEMLIQRPKGIFDQAIPSGSSVTLGCLAALSEIFPEKNYASEAEEQLDSLFPGALEQAFGMSELACVSLLHVLGPIVLTGKVAKKVALQANIFQKYDQAAPNRGLLICHRQACSRPIEDQAEIERLLLAKISL